MIPTGFLAVSAQVPISLMAAMLPDAVFAVEMIVFLALDSALALPGRVLLGPKSRRGLHRSQIRGRRVATSRDAVDLKRLTQSDFVQFWIDKIAGVVVCGSNPIDGGLSEAHGIPMSSGRSEPRARSRLRNSSW